MADVIRWVSKAGKAIAMSTFEYVKELNPTISAFGYAANDLKYNISETVGNLKDKANKEDNLKHTSEFVTDIMKNLKNDIKEANFGDKESDDFDFDDDFGGDFDFSDDDYDEETSEADRNTKFTTDIMKSVSLASTQVISGTTAKSAQYMIKSNTANTKALINNNIGIFEKVNAGLATINHNIINIDNFNRTVSASHYQNSVNFYSATLDLLKENNSMMKELLELQRSIYTPKKSESRQRSIDDFIDADGVFNLGAVKNSLKEDWGDFFSIFFNGEGIKKSAEKIKEHPLKFITDNAVKAIFPKMLAGAMKDFNTTLKGATSTALMKLNSSGGFATQMILSLLGLGDFGARSSLSTNQYTKTAIPFDGITKKSIVEVIPTYLSKIYSAISGQKETRYDFDKGEFVDIEDIQKSFDKITTNRANSIARSAGIEDYFSKYMESLDLSRDRLESLKKDYESIIIKNFKDESLFDHRDSVEKIKNNYELSSEDNAKIIKAMWESLPTRVKMSYAGELYSGMENHNRELRNIEENGYSSYLSLFNNSINKNKDTKLNKELIQTKSPFQSNILTYLSNIADDVHNMKDVIIEGYKDKNNNGGIVKRIFSSKEKKTKPTVTNKTKKDEKTKDEEEPEPPNDDKSVSDYESKFSSLNADITDDEGLTRKHNQIRDIIEQGYSEATTKKEKLHVFTDNAKEIAKHPVQFISAILNIAEDKLYDLVFGKDKNGKSVIDTINENIKKTFEDSKKWLSEKVNIAKEKVKETVNKENIHNQVVKFFNVFGVDIDDITRNIRTFFFGRKNADGIIEEEGLFTNIFGRVKNQFSGIFKYIKNAFSDVIDFLGFASIKKKSAKFKEDKSSKIQEILNKINKSSTNKNESNPDGTGEVEQAAEGIKKVKRTGAVIVSKGEYILPPDMNPYNIKERYKNENKAKEKFILNYGENPALFAEGGEYNPDIDEQVKKWYEEGLNKEEIIKKLKEMENNYKLKKEDYERAPFVMRMQEEATKIIDQLKAFTSDVKGKIPKKDVPDQIQSISKDLMSNIKEYFPSMLAGGVLGGGVSLITGMVGGPLLGAAVGASAALIKKSDAIQEVLFGKMTDDGTRDGSGLVSKKMTKALDKYLPTVLRGATVGGILGITPLIPGGPLAGIMLGSAIGYAQKNEQIQEYLFGEFGVLGKDFKKKVQSALPKVGLGALAGLVAGPFGVTTNILLGSALGFASDTELFKGTIFGNKDKDGKTYGGILQMIREGVVDPMGEFFKESTVTFRNWFKKDIMDPVTNAIQPLTKQVQMMMQSIFEFSINKIKGFFGRDTDGLFAKMIRQNFIDPIVGFTKGSINVLSKPVGGLLSIPSKAIGYAGDHFRRQHVRRGTATYMTAAERIAYREEGNLNRGLWGNGNIIHNDNFADADQIIANMSVDELEQARRGFTYARNASTASKQEMREASSKIGDTLNSMNNISVKAAKTVQKFIKNGQLDKAIQFINTLNIDDNQKEQLLEVVKTEGKRYNDAKEAKEDVIGTREKMYEVLKDMGFKDIKLNNLKKYENLLLAEQMARDPKQEEENDKINEEMKKQDTRHIEIMDVIREATAYLRIMSNPNKEQREAMYDSTIKDIRNSINDGKTEKESKKTIFDKINSRQENIQKEAKEDTKKEVKEDTKKEEEKQENIQNEVKEDTKKEEETKEKDESKKPIWQFEQGLPLKYYKTKDGDIKPDTGHSDTKLNLFKLDKQRKAEEESANTQKSILEKITGIPSMLGEIFNSGKDEKPSALKGLLSKALKVAGVATVVGALPYIYDMYKEKVAPWLQDKFNISSESINEAITNGAKTIVRKIAGVVFGDKETMGIVPWIQQKGIPWFTENALPKIVNYYINGFDFLLTKVVPKMAEMIIVNLPSIGIGILKGIGGLLDNLFNMFENKDIKNGSTSTMGKTGMGITKSESLGSNTLTSTTKLVDVSNAVSGSWDTGNNINQAVDSFNSEINSSFSNSNNITTGGQVEISSEKTKSTGGATSIGGLGTGKVDETMFNSNKERTKKAKEIVKVNNTARKNSNMQLIQGKDSDKVIEAIAPYLDSYVTLDDGTTCTVAELLTSEKTITYQNVDGNEYAVRGVDILSDPTIAKNIFGVDISLSKQERKDNSTHGFSDFTKYLGKVGAIDLVKGTGGAGKLVKIGGRLVQGTSILTKLNKPFSVITGSIGNNMVKGGDALSKLSKNSGGILKGVASDIANLQKVRSIDSSIKSVSQSRYLAGLIDNAESLVGEGNISSIQEAIDINNYLKSRPATEALSEAADIATDNIINEGSEQAVKNATGAAAEAAEKAASLNMTEKTVKEIAEEVVENSTKKKGLISKIASKVTSKLSSSTDGMIKKITTALYDQIIKFFADSRIVKLVSKLCTKYNENIPKKVAEIGKTIAEKIAKKFGENAAKNTTKVFAKLATWLTGPFKVAFLVADFIYGYNNVYNILGITKNSKYHVSIVWKIISGLVNVFNSSFCMGLIPFDLIFDTICNIGEDFGWFENNEEMQELLKARKESESEVNKYNTENGTDYDVDEYNDKDKLMTKIVSTGNKILSGVGNVFKGAYTTITGKDTKETTTTDSNTNQTTATDNTSTYQDTVVYQDSNMASIPSGSGSGLKEKILEIDKKLKEQREEKLKTSNLSSKKITKPIIAKTSDVTVYNKNKTSTTIDETATDSLNVIKKLPDILMDKLLSSSTDAMIEKIKTALYDQIIKFFADSRIVKLVSKLCTKYNENIPKKVAEIGKTIAEKIAKKFGENAAKNTTKVFAKLATWLTGPFKVASMVVDFIDGYNNVYNILGITKNSKYHVSIVWKIISGLVNVFNSSFCMGLIPIDFIFDTICNIGEDYGWFENNEEMQELLKARKESESEVNKYNTENGTDYDVDEYNDKDKLMTKIVSTGNKILSGVGNVFKGAYTTITGKDNTSTYQDTVVYQDSNMASIPSGSGSGLKEKILEIDKKLKEQREEKLKTSNLSSKKITKPIIAKTSDVTVYNKNKTSTTIDETATDSLNVIKKLPDILMDKLINPTDDWLSEMQEPMQELILESFNKSFVTPMQSMFSIFAKLIYSISNSNVITTLIGDPDTPSDTGLLGESTGSTTKTTGIVSKITSTIKNAWSGIKKFFGGSSGMNPDLFISQLDSAYNDSNIGGMSISDKGCGPASATMAINNTLAKYTGGYTDMNTEIGLANQYVSDTGDGVTADYFSDAFSRSGLDTNYMNNKSNIFDSIRAGKSTVLLGQDKNNTSKNNSPYGPGNHYIVANGMSDDGKTIYINDPESNVSNIPYKTEKILNHTQLGISPEIPSAGKSALKIHKKKPKIYYMYYGGDAQNIDGTPTGSTSSTVDGDYVGRYTKSFESGSKGSKATDSCGADGGASFGSYQMTYKHGLARQFMKKYYPDIFNASKWDSGASAAKQLWLAAVNSDPANFFAHEHEFIGEQYYEVGKNLIKSFFNPDTHSRAMQDCIWSWSVHRGPSGMKSGLKEAISTAGISDAQTCDETKLLNACYDQRQKSFAAAGYSKNAKNRYGTSGDSERNRLLALKGQKPIDPKSVNGQVISGDTTASTDGNTNTISNIFDMYNVLDNAFATAFGFNTSSSTSTDSSTTSGNSEGVVSAGATSQKVIDFAIKERPNVNYIYGSDNENTKTFDCSSFTKWVYKNAAGINLNRKSTSQHSSPGMKEIPFSQAQPGDIIEYNRPNTHVGLYMGGNKLIHNLNPSKDCVITEDLDSNGNRVRNDGSVNQYFYKAATIAEQPALNDTSSSTTTNTTFTQKANDVETSGAGTGLIRRRTNKKTKTISGNRNIINNELSKYKGGDTMLYRNFISASSSNTLDDKTKLQAIKDTLHYLNSIDVNTNKLASIVELLTQIIGLISKIIENSSTNKQEMIEAQKEQINSMLNAVSSIITTSKASESSDDNYQLELLIKNVNNLIRE